MTTNREALLLEASKFATPAEQRRIQAELASIRQGRTAAIEQDRELDLSASVTEHLKPVFVHSMHTSATDWLDDVAPDFTSSDLPRVARDVRVAAEGWFRGVSPVVRQEPQEFGEQLRGVASREASQYGTLAPQARQVFVSHVASLYRLAEGTDMADTPSAAGDDPGSNPNLAPWDTEDSTGTPADSYSGDGDRGNPPGIEERVDSPEPDGGSKDSEPSDSSPSSAPAVADENLLDVTDANNAAGSTQAEVAQDTVTAGYHGSLISTRARHFLAVEEGQPFPVPGESDPEQSGEAGTSLPRSVEPTDAPETLDNFIDFNKDDPAAVSSDRAKNISANSARRTAGDQPPWLADDDNKDPDHDGDDDRPGSDDNPDKEEDEAKEASRRFASWVGVPDPFLGGSPDRQGRTANYAAKCGRTDEHGAHMDPNVGFCVGNKGERIEGQPADDDWLREHGHTVSRRVTADANDPDYDKGYHDSYGTDFVDGRHPNWDESKNGNDQYGEGFNSGSDWHSFDKGERPEWAEPTSPRGASRHTAADDDDRTTVTQKQLDSGDLGSGDADYRTRAPKKTGPAPKPVGDFEPLAPHAGVATGPNPQGSTVYDGQAATDQGYKEGFKYALSYSPGKPVPAAVTSSATVGEKYNSQYVVGYRAGLSDGIATLDSRAQAAWAQAVTSAIVVAGSKTAKDFSQEERDKDAKSGDAEPDGSFPIENATDLANAKRDLGRAGDKPSDRAHINERAKALGEPGVGESKESSMQRQSEALPQLELADMDETPSNPLVFGDGVAPPAVDGKGAADVANVKTPGSAPADYPQPNGADIEPAIGDDPADAWVGADAPADSEKTAAFRQRVQASLRG